MWAPLLALAFLGTPAPLDMPRAKAYLVEDAGVRRLEDRFNRMDLWLARASLGRWLDDDGRIFSLYRLDWRLPETDVDAVDTRTHFDEIGAPLKKRDVVRRRLAIDYLSPVDLSAEGRAPHQLPRGFKDVDYWQAITNLSTMVCAFLPEESPHWYLAVWELTETDDIYERMAVFEKEFLCGEWKKHGAWEDATEPPRKHAPAPSERERLRRDARHAVRNYANWHCSDSAEFEVLDDLKTARDFVTAFTNELPQLRQKYAAAVPTPLDGTNVLCVARIFATRDEYLEAAGPELAWSAAYWCPERRELVAYLPQGDTKQLMRTCRHEAFHQYLSYATSMIPTSPWLNEGYAQYFEDTASHDWGEQYRFSPDDFARLAAMLPGVMAMDYKAFYDGTDEARHLKYRLAWSIAVFLEEGAPKVRFNPFKNLKRDYIEALLESHDMRRATAEAFGTDDKLKLFVAEWKKFWLAM